MNAAFIGQCLSSILYWSITGHIQILKYEMGYAGYFFLVYLDQDGTSQHLRMP